MVKRWVSTAIASLIVVSFSTAGKFSASDLRDASKASEEETRDFRSRLELMSDQSLELLDTNTITYEVDGRVFAGIVLPNGTLAPAIVNQATNKRREACIDRYYQLHPATYDAVTGKVKCDIRKADLLGAASELQTSSGDRKLTSRPQVEVSEEKPQKPTVTVTKSKKEPVTPEVSEYGGDQYDSDKKPRVTATTKSKPKVSSAANKVKEPESQETNIPDGWYVPPVATGSGSRSTVYSLPQSKQREFGIRKGTWARAELKRTVRSSDRSEVEIILLESVSGRFKTIPAGTILFSTPSFNGGSNRLDLSATNFLYEDESQNIQASVYDQNKEFGLAGKVIRNRKSELTEASAKALKTTINGAKSLLPFSGDPLADGAGTLTDELLDNEFEYLPEADSSVVEVAPQIVYLQILDNL